MRKSPYLVTVFAALAMVSQAGDKEIVVESFEDGLNSGAFSTPVGKWNPSVTKSTAPGLTASKTVYNDATQGTGEGTARFTPDIPADGKYEVFVTYPSSGNAKGVIHKVVSADGEKQVILDQNGRTPGAPVPANSWHSLGVFTFNKGTAGYIEIADPLTGEGAFAGEPNKRIYADAIRLVPQGFELPAEYVNQRPAGGAPTEVAAARTDTFLPAVGAPAAVTPATTTPAPGASPALPALPGAPTADTAAAPPALPNLPGAAAASAAPPALPPATPGNVAGSLPSLPGAAAVATAPATPAPGAPAALPSLPAASTPAAGAIAALPNLPGSTAPPAGLPALPTSSPAAGAVAQLPALPGAAPVQAGLPSLPSVSTGATPSPVDAVAGLPRLPDDNTKQAADAATALPALPENTNATPSAGTPAVPVMPGLPSASVTPAPAVAGLPGLPAMPALAPPTPTPSRTLPTVDDTPAAGIVAAPPVVASAPSFPPPPSAFGVPATGFSGTPTPGQARPATASGWSLTSDNPANLQWTYDYGAALNGAAQGGKKVLVFFTAKGNRTAQRYENEYFTNPAVRGFLDQMVLVKVDFPRNTKLAYSMGVFGAGTIVVTDASGRLLTEIDQIPGSAEALVTRLQNPTTAAPVAATPAAGGLGVPVDPAAPPAGAPGLPPDPAQLPNAAPAALPSDSMPPPPPPPPASDPSGLPSLPPAPGV